LALSNGRIRWPIFCLGIILTILAINWGEITQALLSFLIGVVGGFLMDCLGVAKLKLWYYTKQPFLSKSYFGVVIPCWGIFAMTIDLLWDRIPLSEITTFSFMTLLLFSIYELPNLKTKSWKYSVSMKIVSLGWLPLVYGTRIIFLLLSSLL